MSLSAEIEPQVGEPERAAFQLLPGTVRARRAPRERLWTLLAWITVGLAALAGGDALLDVVLARGPEREPAVSVASWMLYATVLQASAGVAMARGSRGAAWGLRIGLSAVAAINLSAPHATPAGLAVAAALGAWVLASVWARPEPDLGNPEPLDAD